MSILDEYPVWFTSFWGWSPVDWGCVGFTAPGRRETVIHETPDPFIMVVYVTGNAPEEDTAPPRTKVTGFYLVSHQSGHRDDFTAPVHHSREKGKWVHSLKALRAFDFVPEERLAFSDLYPEAAERKKLAQTIAKSGIRLNPDQIALLKDVPFREVSVYGGLPITDVDIIVPGNGKQGVKAGPINRSGYTVPAEPPDRPKELYALQLDGQMAHFLREPADGLLVYKIGLSMSPDVRCDAFNKMLPWGMFEWKVVRSTRRDGDDPYEAFEAAVAGEDVMKKILEKRGQWLGGEFYAATKGVLMDAWDAGKAAAQAEADRHRQ